MRYFFWDLQERESFYLREGTTYDYVRMRRTAVFLVCCTDVELGLFGEVGQVFIEQGNKEWTNDC